MTESLRTFFDFRIAAGRRRRFASGQRASTLSMSKPRRFALPKPGILWMLGMLGVLSIASVANAEHGRESWGQGRSSARPRLGTPASGGGSERDSQGSSGDSTGTSNGSSNSGVSPLPPSVRDVELPAEPPGSVIGAGGTGDGSGEVVDYVLASVDGEPITVQDLRRFVRARGEPDFGSTIEANPQVRDAIRQCVVEAVLEREAKASNIQVSEDEIAAYISEIRRQNGVNESAFAEILQQKGLTLDTYRRQVAFDILKTRVLANKIRGKINVLESDIDAHLAAHPETGTDGSEKKFHVVQALLTPEEGSDPDSAASELIAKAERIRAEVLDGASLEEMSKDAYSDLGNVALDDLRADLREVVQNLSPGGISEPVQSNGGVYLLQILREGTGPETAARREQVKKELLEERFREAAERFLNEELPKKYHVELKL